MFTLTILALYFQFLFKHVHFPTLCYFIPSKGNIIFFFNILFLQYFYSYDIFYFDYREMSRDPRSLHNLIRGLILRSISVWKHFNFLACPHACNLYVCLKFKNHYNIFFASLMGPFFVEDATKVKKQNHFGVSRLKI